MPLWWVLLESEKIGSGGRYPETGSPNELSSDSVWSSGQLKHCKKKHPSLSVCTNRIRITAHKVPTWSHFPWSDICQMHVIHISQMYGVIRNDIVNKQKLTLSSTQEQPLAKQSQILRSLKNRIKNQPPIWFPARLWEQFEEKGKILTLSSIPEWSFVFSQNWVLHFPTFPTIS